LAQSVWWIASIIGLQSGLIIHIDNVKRRSNTGIDPTQLDEMILKESSNIDIPIHPCRVAKIQTSDSDYSDSEEESISTTEMNIHNEVIDNCEAFLEQSKQERKAIGRFTWQSSRVVKPRANGKKPIKPFVTETEGIDGSELRRRKAAGECQRCAWPRDRKGSQKTLDCFRWKRLEKGTAPFPKKKNNNKD
jgi:hypothetical protein